MSVGTLYQYFANRDAIIEALQQRELERAAAMLEQRLARAEPITDRDLVRSIIVGLFELYQAAPRCIGCSPWKACVCRLPSRCSPSTNAACRACAPRSPWPAHDSARRTSKPPGRNTPPPQAAPNEHSRGNVTSAFRPPSPPHPNKAGSQRAHERNEVAALGLREAGGDAVLIATAAGAEAAFERDRAAVVEQGRPHVHVDE